MSGIQQALLMASGGDLAAPGYLSPFYPTTLYSMRKRNAAYSGPCIKVRNGTTNVKTDIGFDAQGWCDANAINTASAGSATMYVTTWYDQSGGGVHLTNLADDATQPIVAFAGGLFLMGGKPAIRFNQTNQGLLSAAANAAFGYGTGAFTWEVFAQTVSPVSVSGQNNVLVNQRAGGTGADPAQLYVTDSTLTALAWYYGSNINSSTSPSPSTDNHFAANYVGGASSAMYLFLNGVTATGFPSNITMNFGTTDTIIIGRDANSWRGLIAEVAITKGTCMWTANFTPRSYT